MENEIIKNKKDSFDFQKYLANKLKSQTFRKHYNGYGEQLECAYPNSKFLNQQIHVLGAVPNSTKGSLLLELLIAISILAVVLSVGSQAVFVSMQSGKVSSESDVAMGLASEALEATRAVADEKWQNIYALTKGNHYYATSTQPTEKWTLAGGDEAIALNTANYTRYVVVNNVSRDLSTRMIETTYNSAHDDPSTQQVAVTVSWQGSGSPVTMSDYFFRWRNKATNQTSWTGTGDESVSPPNSLTTGDTLHL